MIPTVYLELTEPEQADVAARLAALALNRPVWDAIAEQPPRSASEGAVALDASARIDHIETEAQSEEFDLKWPFAEVVETVVDEDGWTWDSVLGIHPVDAAALNEAEFLRGFDGDPARVGDLMLAQVEARMCNELWVAVSGDMGPTVDGQASWVSRLAFGDFSRAEAEAAEWSDWAADACEAFLNEHRADPAGTNDATDPAAVEYLIAVLRVRADLFRRGPDATGRYFEAPDEHSGLGLTVGPS